eukprot:TRINITY_DN13063_c0_g1_i1.p1 TRINITY_DN13063_c0_g1~~TRINITY_DN13063_c0_g1_i1.p1  ORF type:complete len:182 (-),score=14.96 TRINITY_DN13063_c0_g1_i1:77-580(-)
MNATMEVLHVASCGGMNSNRLVCLGNIRNLNCLNLSDNLITDERLACLSEMEGLTSLYLVSSLITNNGLHHLSRLVNLRSLDISFCSLITDEGCLIISQLFTRLEELSLSKCHKVTEYGLQHLTNLPLKALHVTFCKLTYAGIEYLMSKMPNTVIRWTADNKAKWGV